MLYNLFAFFHCNFLLPSRIIELGNRIHTVPKPKGYLPKFSKERDDKNGTQAIPHHTVAQNLLLTMLQGAKHKQVLNVCVSLLIKLDVDFNLLAQSVKEALARDDSIAHPVYQRQRRQH